MCITICDAGAQNRLAPPPPPTPPGRSLQVATSTLQGREYMAGVRVLCGEPTSCSTTPGAAQPPAPATAAATPVPVAAQSVPQAPPAAAAVASKAAWTAWVGSATAPPAYNTTCPCNSYMNVRPRGCSPPGTPATACYALLGRPGSTAPRHSLPSGGCIHTCCDKQSQLPAPALLAACRRSAPGRTLRAPSPASRGCARRAQTAAGPRLR